MGKRTLSRELALQYLYMVEVLGKTKCPTVSEFLESLTPIMESGNGHMDPKSLSDESKTFAIKLMKGCMESWDEFSEKMTLSVKNFKFHRVFPIDRVILRIALFEILSCDDIPMKVSMNEAIELGKRYSTQKSGSFINGVLENLKTLDTENEK